MSTLICRYWFFFFLLTLFISIGFSFSFSVFGSSVLIHPFLIFYFSPSASSIKFIVRRGTLTFSTASLLFPLLIFVRSHLSLQSSCSLAIFPSLLSISYHFSLCYSSSFPHSQSSIRSSCAKICTFSPRPK